MSAREFESVREMWLQFNERAMHRSSTAVEVLDMRRAFYAGAWAVFTRCHVNAAAAMPQESFLNWLDSIEADIRTFADSIGTATEGDK